MKTAQKYILGADVGYAACGLILFRVTQPGKYRYVASTTIRTEKQSKKKGMRVADDDVLRIRELGKGIIDFVNRNIAKYDGSTHLFVTAELPTGGAQGARANRAMGMATGMAVTVFDTPGMFKDVYSCISEYVTPTDVKVALTGNKSASKDEIIGLVTGKLGVLITQHKSKAVLEHICDAFGCITHSKKHSDMFKLFTTMEITS